MNRRERSDLVYSTDNPARSGGGTAAAKERRPREGKPPPGQNKNLKLHLRLERKGRGGKTVTLVCGLGLPEDKMWSVLKTLKTRLGTGGALKEGVIEIQGDHREAIRTILLDQAAVSAE